MDFSQTPSAWETAILKTFGPGSELARSAISRILSLLPACTERVSPKVRSALTELYGPQGSAPALVRALRVYYATVVLEAGRLIAPRCDVLAGSGAEQYTRLWPDAQAGARLPRNVRSCAPPDRQCSVRAEVRRQCRLFAEAALSRDHPCDLFHRFYEAIFPGALRHATGEYYTPGWLAEFVLDRAGFPKGNSSRLLDPSCGSGVFLVRAAHRLKAVGQSFIDRIHGFDINPLAVLTARVNLLACLGDGARTTVRAPDVSLYDCILGGGEAGGARGCDDEHGRFEFVVGNPPWVHWDNLPQEYRRQTAGLWKRYGLFNLSHTEARLGGGKKDLAMLFTYSAADKTLATGGTLAFVINQGIVQSGRAGAGFRRFKIGDSGDDLRVLRFDDLTALSPFDASAHAAVIVLEKGGRTEYPVAYRVWSRRGGGLHCEEKLARPAAPDRSDGPWEVTDEDTVPSTTRAPFYTARTGAYTGGANGVFWINVLDCDGRMARVRNISGAGKPPVTERTAAIETELIYPLLRWRDVARWRAVPGQHIILVQDAISRKPIAELLLQASFPCTHAYLKSFEGVLRRRKSTTIRDLMARGAFYAMFGVGEYTLSPWKVVWRRMAREFTVAVVGGAVVAGEAKPIVPQETLTFVPCAREDEAHYLCGVLNSPQATAKARSLAVPGGKSFGTAGMLRYFRIEQYNAADPTHAELAELSRRAHQAAARGEATIEIEQRIAALVAARLTHL